MGRGNGGRGSVTKGVPLAHSLRNVLGLKLVVKLGEENTSSPNIPIKYLR